MHTESAAQPWLGLPPTPDLAEGALEDRALINGAGIWYAQWNMGAGAEPVLLLHGGRLNTSYYGLLIPALIAHQCAVIAMDSRGQGRSTRSTVPITYEQMSDDVLGLLDRLHVSKVSLVGWSDGGIIGIDLALRHPERLKRLFAFGANVDPGGLVDNADAGPMARILGARERQEYLALSPDPAQWDSMHGAIGTLWNTSPHFSAAQLSSTRVATTIAHGQYDEYIRPEHSRYMAAQIPGAKLVILPNVSHFAMLQDPALFNAAVVRFLADQ